MKRYCIQCIGFILLSFLSQPPAHSQYQTEGIVKYTWSRIHTNDSTNKEKILWSEWSRIWFKDSSVIYEMRINYQTSDQTAHGTTVVKKSYPVWRYVYLDLRTMICQDYQTFKDTATPFCNYSIKLSDAISIWKFFAPKSDRDTTPGVSTLSDTIIGNSKFKRIKVLYKYHAQTGDYLIYYLNCNTIPNMFHLNRSLNEMFPGCKATRQDLLDRNNKVTGRTEYNILSDKLTDAEENVFRHWRDNAVKTKLPLLSYSQVYQMCPANYDHENPIIEILPLER